MELEINLTARGDDPAIGSQVVYTIEVANNDSGPASNIKVWDTLPGELIYKGNQFSTEPVVAGQYILWELPADFVLDPGEKINIEFTVIIKDIGDTGVIANTAGADYNDPYFVADYGLRHPAVYSDQCFFPDGNPLVYPNPYNPDTAVNGELKFANIVPGSLIYIFTMSGEVVDVINAREQIRVEWDGENRFNNKVSQGIYFYMVINKHSGQKHRGKIFIVGGGS